MSELVGRKVVLQNGHPWAGRSGVVKGVIDVGGSAALRIQLDGAWEPECVAFVGDWKFA